jgi:hypothetical protein
MTGEAEFSISDLVVGRSVRCLPSEEARKLFARLGSCAEDAAIPFSFIVLLWGSQGTVRIKSAAKKLVSVLVLNNLLHRNAGFYTQHDIGKHSYMTGKLCC